MWRGQGSTFYSDDSKTIHNLTSGILPYGNQISAKCGKAPLLPRMKQFFQCNEAFIVGSFDHKIHFQLHHHQQAVAAAAINNYRNLFECARLNLYFNFTAHYQNHQQ